MAYVINKLRDAAQKQNEIKQGSSAISSPTGVGSAPNRTSAFASPMDVINANKATAGYNPNQAVENRVAENVIQNYQDVSKSDTNAITGVGKGIAQTPIQMPINASTPDETLAAYAGQIAPKISGPQFKQDTSSQFGKLITPGLKDFNMSGIVKQGGQRYTPGMGVLDTALAHRSGSLARNMNEETAGQMFITGERQAALDKIAPGTNVKVTPGGDFTGQYENALQAKSDAKVAAQIKAAQDEIARRKKQAEIEAANEAERIATENAVATADIPIDVVPENIPNIQPGNLGLPPEVIENAKTMANIPTARPIPTGKPVTPKPVFKPATVNIPTGATMDSRNPGGTAPKSVMNRIKKILGGLFS